MPAFEWNAVGAPTFELLAGSKSARIGNFGLAHRDDVPERDFTTPRVPSGIRIRSPTLAVDETQLFPSLPVIASEMALPGRKKKNQACALLDVIANNRALRDRNLSLFIALAFVLSAAAFD